MKMIIRRACNRIRCFFKKIKKAFYFAADEADRVYDGLS